MKKLKQSTIYELETGLFCVPIFALLFCAQVYNEHIFNFIIFFVIVFFSILLGYIIIKLKYNNKKRLKDIGIHYNGFVLNTISVKPERGMIYNLLPAQGSHILKFKLEIKYKDEYGDENIIETKTYILKKNHLPSEHNTELKKLTFLVDLYIDKENENNYFAEIEVLPTYDELHKSKKKKSDKT